jgi:hypothetical protein
MFLLCLERRLKARRAEFVMDGAVSMTSVAWRTQCTADRLDAPDVSVVLPCLNEAQTLAACIERVQSTVQAHGITAEVIVADNGSQDGSPEIADKLDARVIHVPQKGYGSALRGGIAAAKGKYVIMGDSDCSYDFGDIPKFLDELRAGSELVIGNRFRGGIHAKAMPLLHRYVGNPVLSFIGRLFFKAPCSDFHCGLRGFSKEAYERMALRTTGMEFASEMIVKASLFGLRIAEVPVTLSPDGRSRPPHLRSWHDGWRHLRFLLMYSPRWLFLYPGALLVAIGLCLSAWLLPGARRLAGVELDIHTLLYAVCAVLVGFQAILFAMFTKVFATTEGLLPEDPKLARAFEVLTLERGLLLGVLLQLTGVGTGAYSVLLWNRAGFGNLNPAPVIRLVACTIGLLTLGVEITLASFFFSVLGLKRQ